MVEGPKWEELELAPESKHRRVILEGKHWKSLCLSYKARIPSFDCLNSHNNLLSIPSPPNCGSTCIVCLMQQKPKRSNSPEGNRT